MRLILIVFFLLSIDLIGQKKCNFDKYVIPENVKVDSNDVYVYYSNDNKYFIAYYKSTNNNNIKCLFQKYLLSHKSLIDIAENAVVYGVPIEKIDSLGNTTYFSIPDNKFISKPNYTYVIESVVLKKTSDKSFTVEIKLGSGKFDENFEIEYVCSKSIKTLTTFESKINESKIKCIRFTGTDF